MKKPAARLLELAGSISDGAPIDWETWGREHGGGEERQLVRSLRRIADVADAYRSLPSEGVEPPLARASLARWGHLEILELVGRGSHGEVFRARDPRVGRDVALKLLRRKAAPEGIVREAHLLSKVRHENVATIYGADERDGRVGIWMEFIEGPTLESKLRQEGPLPVLEAARIGADVCRALAAVHAVGLLHRDVKAANIALHDGRRAVLMDFGVGMEISGAGSSSGDVCGTPLYLAPEAFRSSPQTVETDIYSVGVLLYHLVTGDYPVVGRGTDALAHAHQYGGRQALKDAGPGLPDAFVAAVDRALAPEPGERYRSAEDMAVALDAVVRTLSRKPSRARVRALVLAGTVFAGVAAARFFSTPSANVSPGTPIVVAKMDNRTANAALDAVGTLLEIELQQSSHIQLVEEARIRSALTQMVRSPSEVYDPETSREVAWRLGAPLVLAGTLLPVGSSYSLSFRLELVGGRSPSPMASWSKDFRAGNEKEIFDAVDSAGLWVRRILGEQRRSLSELDLPVREMTTPSWEALDLFHQAEELKKEDRWPDAILLLRQSLEADPDFTMAHMRLADMLSSLTEAEAYRRWEMALESMARRPVSKREELNVRALHAIDTGDYAAAEALYRTLSLLYPSDYRGSYYHGLTLRLLSRDREALERLLDAERNSPEPFFPVLVQIAGTYLAMDDRAGASAYVQKLRGIEKNGWADALQGALSFIEGAHEEEEALFRGMTSHPEPAIASRGYSLLAAALGELGRFDEAAGALHEGIEEDARWGRASARAGKLLDLAHVLSAQGKREEARAACLEALELERGPHQIASAGPLLARNGFLDEARSLLPELDRERDKPLFERVSLLVQGEILLAAGDTSGALQTLRRAAAFDRPFEPKPYLARALRLSGNLDAAADAYGGIARSEGLIWMKRVCERPNPPGFFASALEEFVKSPGSVRLYDQRKRARERLGALRGESAGRGR